MNARALIITGSLAVGVCWTLGDAFAETIEHGRGNIVSVDQERATIELRDPKNRVVTWRFQRDAKVTFTDGAAFYPNPTVRDLRPPMYVHYMSANQVINNFDVVELGFRPGSQDTGGKYRQQGVSRTVTGRVSAYDPRVRQVALEHHGLTEAFQLTDRTDRKLEPGMEVELRTDWSGQQELVSELRVLGTPSQDQQSSPSSSNRTRRQGDRGYDQGNQGGRDYGQGNERDRGDEQGEQAYRRGGASSGWTSGRVVRISSRRVLMEVAGTRETYRVADSRLLRRLRVGDRVRFDWEDRDGRPYITDIR